MAKYSNMYAGDPNKPHNKFLKKGGNTIGGNKRGTYGPESLKDKPVGNRGPGKVHHMGPGSMGPPPGTGRPGSGFHPPPKLPSPGGGNYIDVGNLLPRPPGIQGPGNLRPPTFHPMPALPPKEIEKRLKKLEVKPDPVVSTALVKKVGDQYEYDKDFIYLAYASALASLTAGAIANQSDATNFQLTPYNDAGVLLAFRGYLVNKSIYQSGDPTDYIWESTNGANGFASSERYHTTSTGLQESLGNPTKPGTNITWTVINAGTAVPSTAVYVAERFTLTTTAGAVTSEWKIKTVGKHVDDTVIKTGGITTGTIAANAITSDKVTADAITVDKIDLNGTLSVTANSGAIRWDKSDGDDLTNSGLFVGRNSGGSPRFTVGSAASFIYFNGTTGVLSIIGASVSATTGVEENFFTATGQTHVFQISPLLDTINIQMVGGGGGGRKAGTSDNSSPNAGPGGSSIVKVVQSNGSVRSTHTAGGGAAATHGVGGSFSAGQNGANFAHPGGSAHSSFAGTGGAGGAYNTGNAGAAGGTGAGGGGQGQGGSGSAAEGGGGGGAATFYTTTLSKASGHFVSTDSIQIIVGAAGQGDHFKSGNTEGVRAGGDGGAGRVRLKGEDT